MNRLQTDEEVRRAIWEGAVPTQFVLASSESTLSSEPPPPFFAMASRGSFLHLAADGLNEHLADVVVKSKDSQMWFSYRGEPLKWHLPVGVLYDLHTNGDELPWVLQVHFSDFPEGLLKYTADSVQNIFINAIKEADFTRFGSTKLVMGLGKGDSAALIESLEKNSYDQYQRIGNLIHIHGTLPYRALPVRFHMLNSPCLQEKVLPTDNQGNERTLGDVLNTFVPEVFNGGAGARAVIHGLDVPLDTPMGFVVHNLAFPDTFVHIVLKPL